MGLGLHGGGAAATRWLAECGARVTVTDLQHAEALRPSLEMLSGVPLERLTLGRHAERDFREAGVVVVNPDVRPDSPWLRLARRSGAQLTSEIELFLNACPARVVGVTGSAGKSTTSAMLAEILACDGRGGWLGGNFGRSLLPDLPRMRSDQWAVLELSSFQLYYLSPAARLPDVAVVTNCTANHLDWHGSFAHYRAAKQRLLAGDARPVVLNPHDAESWSWRSAAGHLVPLPAVERLPPLAVPGEHNRQNARCAAAAAQAAECSEEAITAGLAGFCGLPHRLEFVGECSARPCYNDSKATTPEAAQAALAALNGPLWLLAGGHNKGCDLRPLVAAVVARAQGAAFYGACGDEMADHARTASPTFRQQRTETLPAAFRWCLEHSQPGDAILLSPACASLDQFDDYRQRGARFRELVHGGR